ncbi:TetR/AcrR family transcriptional regulator [Anaerosacchariphilus polymeriproducens]|uniref:TetR/AcrR family transcriptional regulator n=1 Tax=Anaerosacchariphilus polymeriproducens TaxID=1812858 RepID=A0A371AYQ2_9FIRM|nr:TetR/AcrR family transcriptional regulator [Anaerosacchariphilus polymeriproducens]RDU24679.1 TetR/AcrR family transcriptional regulator [Anaerosacchariphilus polymeriproducens]
MTRIGNEKKMMIRNNILKVSKELFLTKGYDKTSTSEIAKAVGIAEGTIFNYFKTKAEIFLGIMSEDFCSLTPEELQEIEYSNGVVDIFMEFIEKSLKKIFILPKRVLIEMGIIVMNTAKSKPDVIKKMAAIDFKFMDQTMDIIRKLEQDGIIKDCDEKVFSELIYSAVMYDFLMYIYEKECSIEMAKKNLRKKLEFLCKGCL